MGHDSRAGSIHRLAIPRSRARAFRASPLVSTAVPVIIAMGSRVGGSRAALGVIRHVTLLANAWREDGSFEPSNDALQPTSGAVAIGVNRSGVQAPLAAERERWADMKIERTFRCDPWEHDD